MYRLYYVPGACSLATQTVLLELNQEVEIVAKARAVQFEAINPVGTVPVLVDGDLVLREGAAIMLYLLDKHKSPMLPEGSVARAKAIETILFANATMHPAYGKLFFIAQTISDNKARIEAFTAAAEAISALWRVVNEQLADRPFLGGDSPSAADVMLTVYSRWGVHFPVDILLGDRVEAMVAKVQARPSFQKALAAEAAQA